MEDKFDKYILQQKLMEVIENSTSVQEMANWCARFATKYKGVVSTPPKPPKEEGDGKSYTISQDSLIKQIVLFYQFFNLW